MLQIRKFKSWPRIKRAFTLVTFRKVGQSVQRVGKLSTRPFALDHLTMKEPFRVHTTFITLAASRTARCCATSYDLYQFIIRIQITFPNILYFVAYLSYLLFMMAYNWSYKSTLCYEIQNILLTNHLLNRSWEWIWLGRCHSVSIKNCVNLILVLETATLGKTFKI